MNFIQRLFGKKEPSLEEQRQDFLITIAGQEAELAYRNRAVKATMDFFDETGEIHAILARNKVGLKQIEAQIAERDSALSSRNPNHS